MMTQGYERRHGQNLQIWYFNISYFFSADLDKQTFKSYTEITVYPVIPRTTQTAPVI
jgi:hypothetical protein